MENTIYFDNSATTKPYPEALEEYTRVASQVYANPSALHQGGVEAEQEVEKARGILAAAIGAAKEEILFTSGGTESDNMAILGTAWRRVREGRHLITSKIEHHAVLHTFEYLETQGFAVTYLDVGADGKIDLEQLKQAVRQDTTLISMMMVNNETGVRQPVEEIKKLAPQAVVHTDAVQAFGKVKLNVNALQADLISLSGHKVHGVKGIGALYQKKGIRLLPINYGGGQEAGLRSGTLNTPAIAAFGKAAAILQRDLEQSAAYLKNLRADLKDQLLDALPGVSVHGEDSVNILNVGFEGVRGEVLLHALEAKGIYVSTGSACTSKSTKTSHVLDAMGVKQPVAQGSIRISLSVFNTKEEVDRAAREIAEAVQFLRRFTRR